MRGGDLNVSGNVFRIRVTFRLKSGVAFTQVMQEREHRQPIHNDWVGFKTETATDCWQVA